MVKMFKNAVLLFVAIYFGLVLQSFAQAPQNFFDSNNIVNNDSTKKEMLRNIYLLNLVYEGGGGVCSSFRIHKNWLLTAAHCVYKFVNSNSDVYVRIEEKIVNTKINGEKDYYISIGKSDSAHLANAKVFLYKQNYSEDGSASSHADDIALIYIPNISFLSIFNAVRRK